MAAECPNCRNWSIRWTPGQLCPSCATGADRAGVSSGWRSKLLVAVPAAAARAVALLGADRGVTHRYASAAVDADLIDADDLRGHGPRGSRRWYLA
ncbi:MAG TPA: hypothetical protein VEI97_07530 [bacterium]|nr:hypothetical protein [bacterium]